MSGVLLYLRSIIVYRNIEKSSLYNHRNNFFFGGYVLLIASYTANYKRLPDLVYCTELSYLTSIYRAFPSEQFSWAVAHLFQSFSKHSWKVFFSTSVSAFVAFAATFSVLANHCRFRTPSLQRIL
jgi:hypothetical protein